MSAPPRPPAAAQAQPPQPAQPPPAQPPPAQPQPAQPPPAQPPQPAYPQQPQPPPGPAAGPYERARLALAIVGLVFVTLFGWVVYSLLLSFVDFLFTLWGLLLLLGLVVSGVAFVVALGVAIGRRGPRPPPPGPADEATIETVQTRQM